MRHRLLGLVTLLTGLSLIAATSASGQDFYKGRVIRVVVGFSAGGGFDTYSRTLARYMGKYIPGSPTLIVENMPGAGSLIAANYLYKVAKPDALTFGTFNGNQILAQLLGAPGIEFDARKLEWIGAPGRNHDLCLLNRQTGVTSVEQWMAAKTPLKLGGSAPGSTTDDAPKILKEALGLPLRLVSGYKGTSDIRVAVEAGEVDGLCGLSWASAKATWRKAIESGQIIIMLQSAPQPHPDLPNVPVSISLAKTDEARQLIEAGIHHPSAITYSFSLPPGTPKERVQILRRAFAETVKDSEFLADANKANLEVNSALGEEVEKLIQGLFRLDPKLVAKLKEILR